MKSAFFSRRVPIAIGVVAFIALTLFGMTMLIQDGVVGGGDTAILSTKALRGLPPLGMTDSIKLTANTREFILTAGPIQWTLAPGIVVDALGFNGNTPGPTLRAAEGDLLRVNVVNRLSESTSIHWHGLHLPNAMDGIPGLTQESIPAGGSKLYEFTASHAGTFMYHPHGPGVNDVDQIDKGLYGLLIIDPQGKPRGPVYDRDYGFIIGGAILPDGITGMAGMSMAHGGGQAGMEDSMGYNAWPVNGKIGGAIPPILVKEGEVVRIRFANISNANHPMHLHGQDFRLIAIDGEALEQPLLMNTVNIAPGQTVDLDLVANNPGQWLFHCHELHHAAQGLSLVVRYEGYTTNGAPPAPMDQMPGMQH